MPKETIWHPEAIHGTDDARHIDINWGGTEVTINSIPVDRSAINRAIRALRRARDSAFGADE